MKHACNDVHKASYLKYGVRQGQEGRYAITEFVKRSYDRQSGHSIVECYPKTGRTHQIRIHLQHIGFPIANDVKYGGESECCENNEIHSYLDDQDCTLQHMMEEYGEDKCIECGMIKEQIKGSVENPFDSTRQIWLHALSYKCDIDGWHFCTDLPDWAK